MKAIILAGGHGKRLRPITNHFPKPMVQIVGKPLLEYIIRLLRKYNVVDITIALHHNAEVFTSYFGDGAKWGVKLAYSIETEQLGTAGAVKKLESCLSEPFLVVYGDNLSNCNIAKLIKFHRVRDGVGTIAVFAREDPTFSGIVELDKDYRVLRFLEKPNKSQVFSNLVNAGLLVLEPQILRYVPEGQMYDFGEDLFPRLLASEEILYGYIMTEDLIWVDTHADYEHAQAYILEGRFNLL